MMDEKPMYGVEDVKSVLGVKDSKAYDIIRELNLELQQKGYLTVRGRISARYFKERFFGKEGVFSDGE